MRFLNNTIRQPLLLRQNHSRVLASGADTLGVKTIEIRDVEGVEDTRMVGGKRQLLVVRLADEASV